MRRRGLADGLRGIGVIVKVPVTGSVDARLAVGQVQSQRLTLRDVAKHLAEAGLHAEAVASVLLHLLQQPPINLGVAGVSTSGHVPRHPVNALPLRRCVAELGDAAVDRLRHAAEFVGIAFAFLTEAPVREPLVEGLRLSTSAQALFVVFRWGSLQFLALVSGRLLVSVRRCSGPSCCTLL